MTIERLHKILGRLIKLGHARKPVAVNKLSFTSPLEEDGAVILNVEGANLRWVEMLDDDGGSKQNRDGSMSGRYYLVLTGIELPEKSREPAI